MSLDDIRVGQTIFIDANILIYARADQSAQCRRLLTRCQAREVNGIITTFVVAEFCHRRMMQEAQRSVGVRSNPAKALAGKPQVIRALSVYADDLRALLSGELALIDIEKTDFAVCLEIQRQFGLLTIDSINLASARRLGIHQIATADAIFDQVPGLTIFKPDDLRRPIRGER